MPETLLDRNLGIARRAEQLGPLAPALADILRRGKRDQLLAGRDARGSAYAQLAASTLRRKGRRSAVPLVGDGEASGLIVGYAVEITEHAGRLTVDAGWPGRPYVQYLRSGTRRMPARDPGGFRPEDLAECTERLRRHVLDGTG